MKRHAKMCRNNSFGQTVYKTQSNRVTINRGRRNSSFAAFVRAQRKTDWIQSWTDINKKGSFCDPYWIIWRSMRKELMIHLFIWILFNSSLYYTKYVLGIIVYHIFSGNVNMRGFYFGGTFNRGLPLAEKRFGLSLPGQFQKSLIRGFPNSTVYGIIVTRTYD